MAFDNIAINSAKTGYGPRCMFFQIVLVAIIALLQESFAKEPVSVTIYSDTVIATDVEIPFGASWTIKPGVRILFEGYRAFLVRGLLIAEGTAEKPIIFSAVDRASGSREKPSWKGMEIVGKQAHGKFRHCRFEGAFRNLVWESSPEFTLCEFAGNHYGLYCMRKATPHIKACRFARNSYGIAADFASPLLLDNIITSNAVGVYLQLSSKALLGRNTITGNTTDIKEEEAFGENKSSLSLQYMWKVMQQLY